MYKRQEVLTSSNRNSERAEELGDKSAHERQSVVPHDLAAVSYTHLRAHETVLDLVCRLLLEKKKKNKIQRARAIERTVRTRAQTYKREYTQACILDLLAT